jgi:hypothetical protein
MLDTLTAAAIKDLRLQLYHFANRQGDPTAHSRCLTVVSLMGEAVERDDPTFRKDLANSVARLEDALCGTRRATNPYNFLSRLTIADAA